MSGGGAGTSWPIRRNYAGRASNMHPAFNRALTFRPTFDTSESTQGSSWVVFEERVMTGPLVGTRFPVQPQLPLQILLFDSPPSFATQQTTHFLTQEQDDSTLTKQERKIALSKLKKETYNPILKNLSRRLCLYYRDVNARNNCAQNARKMEQDGDDGKSCAICLEDFEAREEVTVTPCNHMFHENCILPWVSSHGKCPVCRFVV